MPESNCEECEEMRIFKVLRGVNLESKREPQICKDRWPISGVGGSGGDVNFTDLSPSLRMGLFVALSQGIMRSEQWILFILFYHIKAKIAQKWIKIEREILSLPIA